MGSAVEAQRIPDQIRPLRVQADQPPVEVVRASLARRQGEVAVPNGSALQGHAGVISPAAAYQPICVPDKMRSFRVQADQSAVEVVRAFLSRRQGKVSVPDGPERSSANYPAIVPRYGYAISRHKRSVGRQSTALYNSCSAMVRQPPRPSNLVSPRPYTNRAALCTSPRHPESGIAPTGPPPGLAAAPTR